jgi:putative ABC transport system permease protein
VVSGALIFLFIGLLAAWLSDNAQTGRYFALAIAIGMAALAFVAWLLLRGLRIASRHLPRSAGPVVRQGIANLYRPGNHAGAAVMALGVGVMFTITIWIVQRGLLQDIVRTAPPGLPNVYLLDITSANHDAVYDLLTKQKGVEGAPEMLLAVAAQMESIDGVPVRREKLQGFVRRYADRAGLDSGREAPFHAGCRREVVAGGDASGGARLIGG